MSAINNNAHFSLFQLSCLLPWIPLKVKSFTELATDFTGPTKEALEAVVSQYLFFTYLKMCIKMAEYMAIDIHRLTIQVVL